MKLNEKEKQAIISSLKDSHKYNSEKLDNADYDWTGAEEYHQYLIDQQKETEQYLERLEKIDGELEIDTDKLNFDSNWACMVILLMIAFWGNNRNE